MVSFLPSDSVTFPIRTVIIPDFEHGASAVCFLWAPLLYKIVNNSLLVESRRFLPVSRAVGCTSGSVVPPFLGGSQPSGSLAV